MHAKFKQQKAYLRGKTHQYFVVRCAIFTNVQGWVNGAVVWKKDKCVGKISKYM